MHGILCLNKEKDFTSHDAVAILRRLYATKKVGHTGTLDPQATGVLPVLVGKAVKACDLIPSEEKTYLATVRFGLETDTEDIWGKILHSDGILPQRDAFVRAVDSFPHEYGQIPPMVSAIKIGGKKLYEYAREGKTVPRAPRPVTVHSLELLSFSPEEATLRARVSKGTYIRTLLTDLCAAAGVRGAMSSLVREASGVFSLADCLTLSQVEAMTPEERRAALIPIERLFSSFPKYSLPAFFDKILWNGGAVLCEKLKISGEVGDRLCIHWHERFAAVGEIRASEEGPRLFLLKRFLDEKDFFSPLE